MDRDVADVISTLDNRVEKQRRIIFPNDAQLGKSD
jgi:hypothetical protein